MDKVKKIGFKTVVFTKKELNKLFNIFFIESYINKNDLIIQKKSEKIAKIQEELDSLQESFLIAQDELMSLEMQKEFLELNNNLEIQRIEADIVQKELDLIIEKFDSIDNNKDVDKLLKELKLSNMEEYSIYKQDILKAASFNKVFIEELTNKINGISNDFPNISKSPLELKSVKKDIRSLNGKIERRVNQLNLLQNEMGMFYDEYQSILNSCGYNDEDDYLQKSLQDKILNLKKVFDFFN